jgi:pimeloyl-ACP methyl ester carboxylesterase
MREYGTRSQRSTSGAIATPPSARLTADFVAGPFRFETLPGVGHFVTDEAPDAVASRLLSHLGAHR